LKYIIFDIDGTLTDTTEVDDKCFISAFRTVFGPDIRDVNWSKLTNITDWGIVEELVKSNLNQRLESSDVQKMKAELLDLLEAELAANKTQFNEIPGARLFYQDILRDPNFKVGIATGAWEESAEIKLSVIGIDPHKVCFSNSNYHKTREEITSDVIQQLKTKFHDLPEEIIYFGDGTWDYKTCQNLGIKFIGIDNKGNEKLKKLGAKLLFKDFMNVERIKSVL